MARTVKDRREAYDNIAVGSAITTRERTAGAPATLTWANSENAVAGSATGKENVIVAGTALITGERL